MTTLNNDLEHRIGLQGKGEVLREGVEQDGFRDPEAKYPKQDYLNEPSTNKGERGAQIHKLKLKGGATGTAGISMNQPAALYTMADVSETECGHVIEINDTPSGERILIKHKEGSGVELRPDGSIVINSLGGRGDNVKGNYALEVANNGDISFGGNLNFTVQGDFNLDVKGDYNIKVRGKKTIEVIKDFTMIVSGAVSEIFKKTKKLTVLGSVANTFLSTFTQDIKGSSTINIEGDGNYAHKGTTNINSAIKINISSEAIDANAQTMNLNSDKGVYGGANVSMFSKLSNVDQTLTAGTARIKSGASSPVFVGDLRGTASKASLANKANPGVVGGVGAPTAATFTHAAQSSSKPTSSSVQSKLDAEGSGITEVKIDSDDKLKDSIDRSKDTGGVTTNDLDTAAVRSKMKDSANRNNTKFTQTFVTSNSLSTNFPNVAPPGIGRIKSIRQSVRSGFTQIGTNNTRESLTKKYTLRESSARGVQRTLTCPKEFNPNNMTSIVPSTKLDKDITLNKFIRGAGDPASFPDSLEERKKLARNYLPQAEIIRAFYVLDQFSNCSLKVAEGYYEPGPSEVLTANEPNDLASKGRFVAYEIYDQDGKINLPKTYEFAAYLKDNSNYEKLSLFYDEYGGDLHAQIGVAMPEIPENLTASFNKNIETVFNGNLQSSSDLIEITST